MTPVGEESICVLFSRGFAYFLNNSVCVILYNKIKSWIIVVNETSPFMSI